jgi:hypothetical protein
MTYGASIALYASCFAASAVLAGLAQIFRRPAAPVRLSPSFTQTTRPNRAFMLLSLAVPFLLASLRWQVGVDYTTYVSLYGSLNQIGSLGEFFSVAGDMEPFFILLNMIAKALFGSPVAVFFISALLITGFMYRAAEDYHEKLSVMLVVFVFLTLFFSTTLNIMRQMISVAIMFYATRYVFQERYGAAAAWVVIALLFHYSALIVLPFWMFRGAKRYERNIRILLFSSIILLYVVGSMFNSLFYNLRDLYLNSGGPRPEITLRIGLLLLRLPIIVPILIWRKRLIAHDERNYFWIIMAVFEVAFSYLGYILDILNRLALYFAVSWVVLLPSLVRCMPTRAAQYRMGAYVAVVAAGLWVFNTPVMNYGDILPYQSIFGAHIAGLL